MIELRRGDEWNYADHGWLKSFRTASFADYFDPEYAEFSALRVINEDRAQPEHASARMVVGIPNPTRRLR